MGFTMSVVDGKFHVFGFDDAFADMYQIRVDLQQYTGLKDKNDVEIYEGDILLVQWPSDGEDWEAAEVVWWDSGFVLLYDGVFYHLHHQEFANDMRWSDVWDDPEIMITEVIGNIYETPELLK